MIIKFSKKTLMTPIWALGFLSTTYAYSSQTIPSIESIFAQMKTYPCKRWMSKGVKAGGDWYNYSFMGGNYNEKGGLVGDRYYPSTYTDVSNNLIGIDRYNQLQFPNASILIEEVGIEFDFLGHVFQLKSAPEGSKVVFNDHEENYVTGLLILSTYREPEVLTLTLENGRSFDLLKRIELSEASK